MLRSTITENWNAAVDEIFKPLSLKPNCPVDLPSEILRVFTPTKRRSGPTTSSEGELTDIITPTPEQIAACANDKKKAISLLRKVDEHFPDEKHAIKKIEEVNEICVEYVDQEFANFYFGRVQNFLSKHCQYYRITEPFHITPNITGMYVRLATELRKICERDPHLCELLDDFEDSLGDMKFGVKPVRIKTSIQKQLNLLEGMGRKHPHRKKAQTLGELCDELKTWPDPVVQKTVQGFYGFANDFAGVRHAGSGKRNRKIDNRDLVALTCALMGLTPYLTESMDFKHIVLGEH